MFPMHGYPCLVVDLRLSVLERHSDDANDLRSGHILLEFGLKLVHALIDCLDCVRPGITILFLKQASEDIEFASSSFQIVVGKFAPPSFGLAPDLFPLAFQYIIVHGILLLDHLKSCPKITPALGAAPSRRISSLLFSQVTSSRTTSRGNRPQAFSHALRRFTFTNKRVSAGRECSLLTGVQMAHKNNDQRNRTGSAEFIQSCSGRNAGKQIPIN